MKAHERKTLLEKLDRDVGTVGASVPEAVEVEGETVPLRRYLVDDSTEVDVPEDKLKRQLRRRRLGIEKEIEDGSLSYDQGLDLVKRYHGLSRALERLQGGDGDVEREAEAAEIADRKRWRSFLEEVKGEDDDRVSR